MYILILCRIIPQNVYVFVRKDIHICQFMWMSFFLVGCPETKEKRVPLLKLARKWSNFRIQKYAHQHTNGDFSCSKIKRSLLKLYRLQYKVIPERYIVYKEAQIFNYCDILKSSYFMSYCFEANWGDKEFEVYPSRIF